jgi:rhamnosyltransferase
MKNILFFVHYNEYGLLLDYVVYLLEHIKNIYERIVFISNSPIPEDRRHLIDGLCHSIIVRENRGLYYGAWKDALLNETWETLGKYDTVTLMNDTCFGPLFDLQSIYDKMEKQNAGFWGLTNHKYIMELGRIIKLVAPKYIQDYFMCFTKKVVCSSLFQNFWNNLVFSKKNKPSTYKNHENRLTLMLSKAGFKFSVFFDAKYGETNHIENFLPRRDITLWRPDIIIKNKAPFIKIKSFLKFSVSYFITKLIEKNTDYPVSLINEYFTIMYEPNVSLLTSDKYIYPSSPSVLPAKEISSLKIAVHVHAYFLDVFEKYLQYFILWKFNFDLYITTDTPAKKEMIEKRLDESLLKDKKTEVIVTENAGRDILPWLLLAKRFEDYDIVGHFHTKKSSHKDNYFGLIWQDEILKMLLAPAGKIMETFKLDQKIGIIIPDIPSNFHFHPHIFYGEGSNIKTCRKLWKKMKCFKRVNFAKLTVFIMPYGNMFWYRPRALSPLFNLCLSSKDFPAEPIPANGTIAHCIERIVMYIVWNSGYDYRIVKNDKPLYNSFTDNAAANKEFFRILNSNVYRLGLITFFPLKIARKIMVYVLKILRWFIFTITLFLNKTIIKLGNL